MARPTALRKIITARAVDYDVGYRILLRRDRAIQRICASHGPPFAVRSDRPANGPTEESHCPVISSAERRLRPTPTTKQPFSEVTPTICLCAARWATLDSPTRTKPFSRLRSHGSGRGPARRHRATARQLPGPHEPASRPAHYSIRHAISRKSPKMKAQQNEPD
jgi:hypothetical protein